jgi:aminoglycoside phosphotransferase (APT) family kinase protein
MEKKPHCIVHFDATINNIYIDPQSREPRFCDWQCACAGPFMIDVPYHIAGALSVEDRRKHEKDLFAHYLSALKANGGPAYTVEELWLDYRRYEMGMGWIWCTCSYLMQPPETVAAMTERHAAAVADHHTLEALGV